MQRTIRIAGLPPDQFRSVVVQDRQQLLIIDIPERPTGLVLAQKSDVSQQLPQPNLGGQLAEIAQQCEGFVLGG